MNAPSDAADIEKPKDTRTRVYAIVTPRVKRELMACVKHEGTSFQVLINDWIQQYTQDILPQIRANGRP